MATSYHNLSDYNPNTMPPKEWLHNQRYAIVVADWNREITFSLCEGARHTLEQHGVQPENIILMHVPGAFELSYAAARLQKEEDVQAVIAIGCVVRGDTPHFDYICQGVTSGLTQLNCTGILPVIFGVLTTDTMQQALDRAGGMLGNKGVEAAVTAIKMANLRSY
ncbi:MAG: 6,7-dimethyl-8-ribityllumazine synthase [Prevotellaceae bacterium]|jgi:6,7-dimethyl-8-ribityllumazine synthase|nr:6,7-dimethyl-8-ribityllumazine synthase [Prevotellaceae bacterium]